MTEATDPPPAPITHERGHSRARALATMAPVVQFGCLAAGVSSSLAIVGPVLADHSWHAPMMAAVAARAVATLLGYTLVGWLARRMIPALAEALEQQNARAENTARLLALVEDEVVPRLTEALQRRAVSAIPARDGSTEAVLEVRRAIRASEWPRADELVRAFADEHPEHPEASRLPAELGEARQAARDELRARINAAREANDPDRVLELRNSLLPLLAGDLLRDLDRDLAKWFMVLIHKRLRAGTMRPDVAVLAGRVAESLDDTPEGASLRAALPTLRRSAGLCARCAQPYTGVADACPKCLSSPVLSTPPEAATP